MALEVIGAGLGRNATFSLKFALEKLGFGPCYHMAELFAGARRSIPLWQDVADDRPDWDAIYEGYRSTTDYPSASYWRELAAHYPDAKVVLTTRDADSWFDSVSETIFSPKMLSSLAGSPMERVLEKAMFSGLEGKITDRAFMTDWYRARNAEVMASLPAGRVLHFHPKEGWEPLCAFLGVAVPAEPFPRVNDRIALSEAAEGEHGLPADPAELESWGRDYIAAMRAQAFPGES